MTINCLERANCKANFLLIILASLLFQCVLNPLNAQVIAPKFGDGLLIVGQDSSFYMKVGMRFQTLYATAWDLSDSNTTLDDNSESNFRIRRARLKFDGWAITSTFKYKCELVLVDRNAGASNNIRSRVGNNLILDAFINWNFYKGLTLWVGQGKVPGNRERIISSGDMQFVDRSRLNSLFTLDRDVGFMLSYQHKLGEQFFIQESVSISSGEGENINISNVGGHSYNIKLEALPFGKFKSRGQYVGSAIERETSPRLAVAITYNLNQKAGRERGQKGNFIVDESGKFYGKNLNTFFIDMMFKYRSFSMMAEYAYRSVANNDPFVYSDAGQLIGTYYTGHATNIALGYMTENNWELALRWTDVNPTEGVDNHEIQYSFGLSKYIIGHKLKVQSDLTYRSIDLSEDKIIYRLQMDIHF